MMTISRMMMPTIMQIRIFMSFHHICLRTRLAPRRKPCADVARLSVLSCRASRRSPRCEALFRLSCIWRTVLSISYCRRARGQLRVFARAARTGVACLRSLEDVPVEYCRAQQYRDLWIMGRLTLCSSSVREPPAWPSCWLGW
jgi:hypothetical protein